MKTGAFLVAVTIADTEECPTVKRLAITHSMRLIGARVGKGVSRKTDRPQKTPHSSGCSADAFSQALSSDLFPLWN